LCRVQPHGVCALLLPHPSLQLLCTRSAGQFCSSQAAGRPVSTSPTLYPTHPPHSTPHLSPRWPHYNPPAKQPVPCLMFSIYPWRTTSLKALLPNTDSPHLVGTHHLPREWYIRPFPHELSPPKISRGRMQHAFGRLPKPVARLRTPRAYPESRRWRDPSPAPSNLKPMQQTTALKALFPQPLGPSSPIWYPGTP
jgi:hypothetical protein